MQMAFLHAWKVLIGEEQDLRLSIARDLCQAWVFPLPRAFLEICHTSRGGFTACRS